MEIKIYPGYDAMSEAAAEIVAAQLAVKPGSVLVFPSGDSPTGMLQYLVNWANEGRIDLTKATIIGLDEWVGMDENDRGSCKYYLQHNFFGKLNTKLTNVKLFDAKAGDLQAECNLMNDYINDKGGLDIMIVGIGMNGHIGLNEPGTPLDLYAHSSQLDAVTVQVGQKYFEQETALTKGITLGLKHFAEVKQAILIAAGAKKAGIIAQSLQGKVTTQVPASILQTLPEATVLLDQDAAEQLSK